MHYAEVLAKLNGWGKYQKWLCFLLTLSTVPNGYLTMIMVFTSKTPEHRCRVLELDGPDVNETSLPIYTTTNVSDYIPWNEMHKRYERCTKYITTVNYDSNDTKDTIECDIGYVFDVAPGERTAVTEWNMVCDDAYMKPRITSLYMAGILSGSFVSGAVSDWLGRRPVIIASTYGQFIFMGLNMVCTSPIMYAIFMFLAGGCSLINFVTAVVMSAEIIDASHRAFVETCIMVGFSIGYAILPLFAFFILDWKILMLAVGLTGVIFIPYWWLLPESPRWLITKKKFSRAITVLKKIAKINGCQSEVDSFISEENLQLVRIEGDKDKCEEHENVRRLHDRIPYVNLFIKAGMLKRTLIMCFNWFVIALTYYTVNLNTGNMGGNDLINCFVSALVEIPAYCSVYLFLRKRGRRWLMIVYLLLGSLACVVTPFIAKASKVAAIASAMTGKFFVTSAFGLVYLYTAELFPTEGRNQAFGLASMCARIGSILVPYILYIGEETNKDVPYLVIGSCGFICALLNIFLPETSGNDIPDTDEEAEKLKVHSRINVTLRNRLRCCGTGRRDNLEAM